MQNTPYSTSQDDETHILEDPMDCIINDVFGLNTNHVDENDDMNDLSSSDEMCHDAPVEDTSDIQELLKDGGQALYEGKWLKEGSSSIRSKDSAEARLLHLIMESICIVFVNENLRGLARSDNLTLDNVSIQGNEPNVDSFSNTQSGNAIERQIVRKPNVEKDQGKITKPNVSNVSESSVTPSHNVTTKKNIKRKTFASNVSSGNVKRKKSVPKSANHSGSVSESSAAQSGTVGRSAAQSGTVGRSAARTVNTTQTQSGTVERW
ncbi:hypothetical protein ACFE04_015657 [Oxalis oulophora]